MTAWKNIARYTETAWPRRKSALPEALAEIWEAALASCGEEEALLLRALLATLPLSDLGDYGPELLLGCVRHGLRVRAGFPWCAALPEELFFRQVLCPRVNNEQLAPCRALFYEKLRPRVAGLPLEEAILEVNRWCAEEATYRSTDGRTASALAVYQCGYGRCGEESTFAVNALRAVGIAARQVYAPWWSHCDDNHAWVEVFTGSRWQYLGACEPEPELDRGWFTGAAARAMLIHARSFAPGPWEEAKLLFPQADPLDTDLRGGVVYESVTQNYAPVVPVTVVVRDPQGRPLPGARVAFSLLNMGELAEIASRTTGPDGAARLRLGKGSVWVTAQAGGLWAEGLLHTGESPALELTLGRPNPQEAWLPFDFAAPSAAASYPAPLPPAQKQARRACLDHAARLREAKLAAAVPQELSPAQGRVAATLTEKDRASHLPPAVLEESLDALAWENSFPPDVFEPALLCPRIALEPLAPWRRALADAFPEPERARFRSDPAALWAWVAAHIREEDDTYPGLPATPLGIFRLKAAAPGGREVLFCALCRSLGVPARLSCADGRPEYWRAGAFRPVGQGAPAAAVTLRAPAGQPGVFHQNYTLARRTPRGWAALAAGDVPAEGGRQLSLVPGTYRLLTTQRLPAGDQLAQRLDFTLAPGEEKTFLLSFRQGRGADLLARLSLPPFALCEEDGTQLPSEALLRQSPLSLLLWLEPGREPTEHILNELREAAEKYAAIQDLCQVRLVLEDLAAKADPTLQKTLAALPQAKVYTGEFPDTVTALARRMFVEPERYPLLVLADSQGSGLYACSGYNVGTGELVLDLAEAAREIIP